MFRKDEEAAASWSREKVRQCAAEQRRLLQAAYALLKPGGMRAFIRRVHFPEKKMSSRLRRCLRAARDLSLLREERLWPHRHAGEGHYYAVIKKAADSQSVQDRSWQLQEKMSSEQRQRLTEFEARHLQNGVLPPPGAG